VATTLECRGEKVAERLKGNVYGRTRVVDAHSFVTDEDDEEVTYLDLVLADPSGDAWPLEDVLQLRRAILEVATAFALDSPLYVRLSPQSNPPQQDDDQRLFQA
jgi:hypothetical protein